jgi:nitrogen fixation/metabolism regulation signal transduction histidine kinase
MASNNFRAIISLRIAILVLLSGAFVYSLIIAHWIITSAILLILVVAVAYTLVSFVEKTNREFTAFLLAIKSADFSKHSTADKRGPSFIDLKKAMNIILEEFQMARTEKEAHFVYLQTALEQMSTAVISFDSKGTVRLINQQAKTLLDIPYLKNINALRATNDSLYRFLTADQTHSNRVQEININGERLKLSVRSSDFSIQGVGHKLVSIQNIRSEIENTELEAWEQLLHVLTHEIMNSITPLSSLSATLQAKAYQLLADGNYDEEAIDDLSTGLAVIARRSDGLMAFVNHYRTFTTLPPPELRTLDIKALIGRVVTLKHQQLLEKNITLKLDIADDVATIICDSNQIEQVLINILNNAIDVLAHTSAPEINIVANVANGKPRLQIIDNGPGIENENLEKIFIPFFSTKSNGTGVGLSLSRQIMRMHGGTISVSSSPGQATTFSLEFP